MYLHRIITILAQIDSTDMKFLLKLSIQFVVYLLSITSAVAQDPPPFNIVSIQLVINHIPHPPGAYISCGNQVIGSNTVYSVWVVNADLEPVSIGPLTKLGTSEWNIVQSATGILAATDSLEMKVSFNPESFGVQTGNFIFTAGSSFTAMFSFEANVPSFGSITCRGVNYVPQNVVDMGNSETGTISDSDLWFHNKGSVPIVLDSGALSGNENFTFSQPFQSVTVPEGDSLLVRIRFSPSTPGPKSGELKLFSTSGIYPFKLKKISLESTTGVSTMRNVSGKIVPNPASDRIFITGLQFTNTQYGITDSKGGIIRNGLTGPGGEIEVSSLSSGIYSVRWFNDGMWHNSRFVK